MQWITTAFRPSTRNAHLTHFKTSIAFAVYMNFKIEFSLTNILAFLEFLVHNKIPPGPHLFANIWEFSFLIDKVVGCKRLCTCGSPLVGIQLY